MLPGVGEAALYPRASRSQSSDHGAREGAQAGPSKLGTYAAAPTARTPEIRAASTHTDPKSKWAQDLGLASAVGAAGRSIPPLMHLPQPVVCRVLYGGEDVRGELWGCGRKQPSARCAMGCACLPCTRKDAHRHPHAHGSAHTISLAFHLPVSTPPHTHRHTRTHTHTHTHTRARARACTRAHTRTHTCIFACSCACVCTHIAMTAITSSCRGAHTGSSSTVGRVRPRKHSTKR